MTAYLALSTVDHGPWLISTLQCHFLGEQRSFHFYCPSFAFLLLSILTISFLLYSILKCMQLDVRYEYDMIWRWFYDKSWKLQYQLGYDSE